MMLLQVVEANNRLSPIQDNGMVSIPRSSQGFDIPYTGQLGDRNSYRSSSSDTPTSPNSSWEESLQLLSRNLQVICCSPDRYDNPQVPQSPQSPGPGATGGAPRMVTAGNVTPGPRSPLSTSSPRSSPCPASPTEHLRNELKLLTVRHVQSEERLKEKLTSICRSPRRLQSMVSDPVGESPLMHSYPSHPPSKLAAAASAKRKALVSTFKMAIDIGKLGVEDLHVYIEEQKLKVSAKEPSESTDVGELPASIDIPAGVDLSKLICVVRDGVLEVREGKNRGPPKGRFLHGLDLRRSLSMGGPNSARQVPQKQANPIVIEDEGSHKLKLILHVPTGYTFDDLKIKTVDDLLIISGKKNFSPLSLMDTILIATQAENMDSKVDEDSVKKDVDQELFHVFELPSSVDPYSMTAHLADNNKLVIQADLSGRDRSNTM